MAPLPSTGHAPDVGRRVVQCACGWAVRWPGEDLARARGWRARYLPARGRGDLVRVWSCPSCYVPSTSTSAPTYTLPAQLLEEGRRHPGRAAQLLEQLLQVDRERAEAYACAIAAALRSERTQASAFWAAWMRGRGRRARAPRVCVARLRRTLTE